MSGRLGVAVIGPSLVGPKLRVTDFDSEIKFMTNGLGMHVLGGYETDYHKEVMLGFNPDTTHPSVCLHRYKRSDAAKTITHGDGLLQMSVQVRDMEAAATKLKAAGYELGEVYKGAEASLFTVKDPEGYVWQVFELPGGK
jgi:Glyoxalase/Bleomycin resistance protein/Dioxygenase superfamily